MRIAWLGPFPSEGGGVAGMETVLLRALAETGHVTIDAYFVGDEHQLPHGFRSRSGLKVYCEGSSWSWGRWYSRNPLMAFITGQMVRVRLEKVLIKHMVKNHHEVAYDIIHQVSHIELFFNPKLFIGASLILHPEVHAQGEFYWMRKEAYWARRLESSLKRKMAEIILWGRSLRQRRSAKLADGIVCPKEYDGNGKLCIL